MKTDKHHTTNKFLKMLELYNSPMSGGNYVPIATVKSELSKSVLELKQFSDEDKLHAAIDKASLLQASGNGAKMHYVYQAYTKVFNELRKFKEEDTQIHRMEAKAHRRNLFYRVATTLMIGFSIMTVYAVAQYFEIAMPLMKLPLPTG